MDASQHNKIVNFVWGMADDVLRDLYVRGKYRDVILPSGRPEPELDRLSSIVKTFTDLCGDVEWDDADRVRRTVAELPGRVGADPAYRVGWSRCPSPSPTTRTMGSYQGNIVHAKSLAMALVWR
jgi:hypothetical protein